MYHPKKDRAPTQNITPDPDGQRQQRRGAQVQTRVRHRQQLWGKNRTGPHPKQPRFHEGFVVLFQGGNLLATFKQGGLQHYAKFGLIIGGFSQSLNQVHRISSSGNWFTERASPFQDGALTA